MLSVCNITVAVYLSIYLSSLLLASNNSKYQLLLIISITNTNTNTNRITIYLLAFVHSYLLISQYNIYLSIYLHIYCNITIMEESTSTTTSTATTTTTKPSHQSPSQAPMRRPRGHSNISDADLELQELPEWVLKGEEGGATFQGQDKMIKKFVITGGPCSGKVGRCIYVDRLIYSCCYCVI